MKRFYGLAGNPTIFQERINRTLEYKHPEGLHYIKLVTKGDAKKHEAEVRETMKQLENAGFRLNPKQCEFFDREIEWVGQNLTKLKKIEQLEKEEPTAETLVLTNRWKELVKANGYKMTSGVWKKYNTARFHRMEIKR